MQGADDAFCLCLYQEGVEILTGYVKGTHANDQPFNATDHSLILHRAPKNVC